jgi:hypothetical protein
LFSESFYNNYENLKSVLAKNENFKSKYAGVDLKHYINDCDTWSETKRVKRTNRGWLLTLRKFMRDAKETNRLQLLKDFKQKKGGFTNY